MLMPPLSSVEGKFLRAHVHLEAIATKFIRAQELITGSGSSAGGANMGMGVDEGDGRGGGLGGRGRGAKRNGRVGLLGAELAVNLYRARYQREIQRPGMLPCTCGDGTFLATVSDVWAVKINSSAGVGVGDDGTDDDAEASASQSRKAVHPEVAAANQWARRLRAAVKGSPGNSYADSAIELVGFDLAEKVVTHFVGDGTGTACRFFGCMAAAVGRPLFD
jgi:hypothetical protein